MAATSLKGQRLAKVIIGGGDQVNEWVTTHGTGKGKQGKTS